MINHIIDKSMRSLFKYVSVITVICIMVACENDTSYKSLYGRWKIYKYTTLYTRIGRSDLNEDKMINHLMGKEIVLNKAYMIIDEVKYKDPGYKIREEKTDEYFFWYWRINKQDVEAISIQDDIDNIKVLNVYVGDKDKEECVSISWLAGEKKEYLYFNEIIYHNGALGIVQDTYFFHLKKIK